MGKGVSMTDETKRRRQEGESEPRGVSRRSFLRFGGLAAGAAALAGAGALTLGGCAPQGKDTDNKQADASGGDAAAKGYTVYQADILIIGGGFGAMSAVDEITRQGRNALIVDKGPFGFSGGCGMNWDVAYTWTPADNFKGDVAFSRITQQTALKKACLSDPNANGLLAALNWGECCPDREEDGTIHYKMKVPSTEMIERCFPRHNQDQFEQSELLTIHDRTMITDLFVNDGVCLGAMGIHLPTGEFRVYRANATMLATGGCCWMYGWNTVAANSINVPDNTADVEMAAFRHGAAIGEAEWSAYDLITSTPSGIAYGFNAGIGADSMDVKFIFDKDGTAFCLDPQYDQERLITDRAYFMQIIGKTLSEGKGSPNGGVYVECGEEMQDIMRQTYRRSIPLFKEKFGIDVTKDLLECSFEMYEHGGFPMIDETMMSTDLTGLFCVRGAGVYGEGGGVSQRTNMRMGSYTTRCMIDWLKGAKAPESVDWSPIDEELTRIKSIRTQEADGGLRPHEIRHKIQQTCGTSLGVVSTKEELEASKAELARIRDEDLPKQYVSNKTLIFNTEWKEAIENYNLLDIAQMTVEARLTREESRGQYYRPDFPEKDDTNWRCILAWRGTNGSDMKFEKVEMPIETW